MSIISAQYHDSEIIYFSSYFLHVLWLAEMKNICMVSGQNNIIQDQSHRAIRNHSIFVLPLFVYLFTSGAGTVYPSGAPEFTSVFSGVRVTRSLVLYVCFVDRCLFFCTFSFGHCVVCSTSIDSDYPFGIFKLFLQDDVCVVLSMNKLVRI